MEIWAPITRAFLTLVRPLGLMTYWMSGLHREPGREGQGVRQFQDRLGALSAQVAAEGAVVRHRGKGVLVAPGPEAAVDGARRCEIRHRVDALVGRRDEGARQRESLAAPRRALPIDDLVDQEIEAPVAAVLHRGIAKRGIPVRVVVPADAEGPGRGPRCPRLDCAGRRTRRWRGSRHPSPGSRSRCPRCSPGLARDRSSRFRPWSRRSRPVWRAPGRPRSRWARR